MKNTDPLMTRLPSLVILIAGIVAAALGVVTMLGWILGLPLLASFRVDWIPMAPSSAVLFILYGVAISLRVQTPPGPRAERISVAMVGFGSLVALLLFALGCMDVHSTIEHLGVGIEGTIGSVSQGHMSPVTAFGFLLASASLLALSLRPTLQPWRGVLAYAAASILLATCFILLLAYIYGAPLLYGGRFIPPAFNTLLAFVMLALGLLALACRAWLLRSLPGDDSRANAMFASVFLLLAMGIVAAGYIHYRNYERHHCVETERQLAAVADLKVDELVLWRKERLADAGTLYKNIAFSSLVRRFFDRPDDLTAQQELRSWLGKIQTSYQYDRVALHNAADDQWTLFSDAKEPISSLTIEKAREVESSGRVMLPDFYRNESTRKVRLRLLVPILDEQARGRAIGTLLLRIDPKAYLYPFVQRWPTPSRTSELLLVRREGKEVVFLNELRFKKGAALNLRISLDQTTTPAVKAVLGESGSFEGLDYRGTPVLAALRAVPDSPWFLVAKVDADEVYAPLRAMFWTTVALVCAVLAAVGATMERIWRWQQVRFYRERAEATEAMRASEVRYRRLFEAAKDGIVILDADSGMIVDVNPFLVEMLGFSHREFLGKKIWELGFFKDIVANQANFDELQRKEYIRYEDLPLETADGRRLDVEFVSNVYQVNHHKVIQCNIRDITDRKRAEQLVEFRNRDLETLLHVTSHDLREPLRAISGFAQLVAERYSPQLDGKGRDFLARIMRGADRLDRLLDDVLMLSRARRMEEPGERVSGRQVVDEALRQLEFQIKRSNAHVHVADDLPELQVNMTWATRAVSNLLANAMKFTQPGEAPDIEIAGCREQDRSGLVIRDRGAGVAPEYADRIFQLFQRAVGREVEGTGAGLAIVRQVAERHGGRVWVQARPEGGAEFYITFGSAKPNKPEGTSS